MTYICHMSNGTELYHHGILGMKWGVRRYQNKDGSLTPQGKKRYSNQYQRYSEAGDRQLERDYTKLYVSSYNKAADRMNSGLIDKFNASQKKKYGDNFSKRKEYEEDYLKFFEKEFNKYFQESLYNYRLSNDNYRKADALVEQYDMTSWDDLARSNQEAIKDLEKRFGKR